MHDGLESQPSCLRRPLNGARSCIIAVERLVWRVSLVDHCRVLDQRLKFLEQGSGLVYQTRIMQRTYPIMQCNNKAVLVVGRTAVGKIPPDLQGFLAKRQRAFVGLRS